MGKGDYQGASRLSSWHKSRKGFINTSKKLYFFLFYLPLDIKNLLLLGLKGLILLELYIPSSPGFKEFLLNYLC
jgi:hypothetical protein